MSLKLHTIIGSTRPGRVGPRIATWFNEFARSHAAFDPVLVDLEEFRLPVYDEPEHPMRRNYKHAHTQAWSRSVDAADAYVFVTPEYNYGPPPALVNALTYVYAEWNYKPAGFVSYGGVSGGLRAAQAERHLVTTHKMVPLPEGVAIPNFGQHLDENGEFKPNDLMIASAKTMLDEMHRWAVALKPMRQIEKAIAA